MQGVREVGLYARNQNEALAFHVDKLGFRVHTDVRNGPYRWLKVQHPDQSSFQLGDGKVDAGFREPSGNGWKMIESRRKSRAAA